MAAVSLATLRARAQRRANMENSSFVSTQEWLDYINEAAKRLHEMLVEAFEGEYVVKEQTFTTIVGTQDYALPADFFKLLAVDLAVAGRQLTLRPYPRTERNVYRSYITGWWRAPRYHLMGSNMRLAPVPDAAYTGTWMYAPLLQVAVHGGGTVANEFVNDDDTINFPNGWEKYIVADAAVQALNKEESDATALKQERARMEQQLIDIREQRNSDQPMQAVDVEAINLDGILP